MNRPYCAAEGSQSWNGYPCFLVSFGMPGPVAHSGEPPTTLKSTRMPSAVASRTIASYGAHLAAAYAAGLAPWKPTGALNELGSGAIVSQRTARRTTFAPSWRICSNVLAGLLSNMPSSCMIETCVCAASAAGACVVSRSIATTRGLSRTEMRGARRDSDEVRFSDIMATVGRRS